MIILDLDGCLADFTTAACEVHGQTEYVSEKWDFFKDWGLHEHEFWAKIHRMGDHFYESIVQPYPWAVPLIHAVHEADEFVVMSAPSNSIFGYAGKKIWLDKYIQPFCKFDIPLIVGSQKHLLAGHDRLLVDDCDANIKEFHANGGYTLLFGQLWNEKKAEPDLSDIYKNLNSWKSITRGVI